MYKAKIVVFIVVMAQKTWLHTIKLALGESYIFSVEILDNGHALKIASSRKELTFHAIWLRDNSQDPETRSPTNGQRLISLNEIPENISIISASIKNNSLKVTFSPEQKTIFYEIDWLEKNSYENFKPTQKGWLSSIYKTWGSDLEVIPLEDFYDCLLYTSPSPRDMRRSRMPSSA